MKKMMLAVMALFILAACQTTPQHGRSAMVLMAEPDIDGVSRTGPAADRMVDAVMRAMRQAGYRVYDEAALDYRLPDRVSAGDLIDEAQASRIGRRVDVLVLLEADGDVRYRAASTRVNIQGHARMIRLASGRQTGSVSSNGQAGKARAGADCGRPCLNTAIRTAMSEVGEDLGYKLARQSVTAKKKKKRKEQSREKEHVIMLDGFGRDNLDDIEYYMTEVFSGYIDHDLRRKSSRRAHMDYVSTASSKRLRKNLVRMAGELDLDIDIRQSGKTWTIRNLDRRTAKKKRRKNSDLHEW